MYQKFNSTNPQLDRVMSEEQFNQIVEAIVSGKYSWACLLILRFSGYNPLHYIPYRTYNRLMKDHREQVSPVAAKDNKIRSKKSNSTQTQKSTKLRDLCYMENADRQSSNIKGAKKAFSFQAMTNMIWHKFSDRDS